jgi:anti-anti-sigma regulatory factor
MNIQKSGHFVLVTGITTLDAEIGRKLKSMISNFIGRGTTAVEIDLSQAENFDCVGIGCIHRVYDIVRGLNPEAVVRVVNPTGMIKQLLLQTQVVSVVEIVERPLDPVERPAA